MPSGMKWNSAVVKLAFARAIETDAEATKESAKKAGLPAGVENQDDVVLSAADFDSQPQEPRNAARLNNFVVEANGFINMRVVCESGSRVIAGQVVNPRIGEATAQRANEGCGQEDIPNGADFEDKNTFDMLRKVMGHVPTIVRNWPLVWELAKTQFKLRYAGSILGYVWAILQPLLLFLILLFVFSLVFRASIPHYALHLLTGIIVWTYFAEGTRAGLHSFLANAHLLKNISLPRYVILSASIVHVTITFGINLVILAGFYLAQGMVPSLFSIGYSLLFLVCLTLLILGTSLALAPLHVLFRDLGQIWEVVLTLGFYSAPIIYSLTLIPPQWQPALWLNPVGYIIHFQREALLFDRYTSPAVLVLLLTITFAVLFGGMFIYSRLKARMVDYL